MDIPDWLSFFDKAFPVQPHGSGIPWFIQLYFCQSEGDWN